LVKTSSFQRNARSDGAIGPAAAGKKPLTPARAIGSPLDALTTRPVTTAPGTSRKLRFEGTRTPSLIWVMKPGLDTRRIFTSPGVSPANTKRPSSPDAVAASTRSSHRLSIGRVLAL
jgi:hypothetical protein